MSDTTTTYEDVMLACDEAERHVALTLAAVEALERCPWWNLVAQHRCRRKVIRQRDAMRQAARHSTRSVQQYASAVRTKGATA